MKANESCKNVVPYAKNVCARHILFFFFFPSNFQSSFFNKKIKFQNSWNIHERSWIITNWINMQQDCVFYTDWSIRKRRIQRKRGGKKLRFKIAVKSSLSFSLSIYNLEEGRRREDRSLEPGSFPKAKCSIIRYPLETLRHFNVSRFRRAHAVRVRATFVRLSFVR